MGIATPMPIFAPVDIPPEAPALCVEVGVDVAAAVVVLAPVLAAVFCAMRLATFLSLFCHRTWITSAMIVSAPSLGLTVVKVAEDGTGSFRAV